ncbi:MAG: lysophospholipid acyltransferase family protein, partial [Candidatus Accumulibacter sp.]|nr:lysophospholipid acyltransferase family protein [Accumulibacter sp.]
MFSVDAVLREKTSRTLPLWLEKLLQWGLRYMLHEREFAEFAANHPDLRGIDCVERVLDYFEFLCEVTAADLANIPADGPVVLVANHPIGSLDGLALVKMVAAVRPDVKIMANRLLSRLEPLQELFIAVENMEGQASRRQIRIVQRHLQQGGALIMFPAGEVSRLGWKGVRDGKWNSGFFRLAARVRAPIVPIHLRGKNSGFFYLLSLLYKPLSTCLLVHEMFGQRGKTLEIRIGNRIPYFSWHDKETSATRLAARFRRHVYKIGKGKPGHFSGEAPIAPPEDRATLAASVERCEILGRTPDEKIIYLYRRLDTETFSPILRELGRLREIAFRAVGEGTGHALDLDRYDDYYYHLILWDARQGEIVGAYRFIPTTEQIRQSGAESLYSHHLFNYQREMDAILKNGIELGRSFIQPAYWGKRGLDYLWQGIGAYLARYPQYRYLFGAVSISSALPPSARDLLVSFYRLYFPPRHPIAVSRRPYPASPAQVPDHFSGMDYRDDLQRLKSMLGNMNCGIPTLYKQYSELCEPGGVQFIDFGVDPDFNDCIDGLVLVDISLLKPTRYRRYIEPHLGAEG